MKKRFTSDCDRLLSRDQGLQYVSFQKRKMLVTPETIDTQDESKYINQAKGSQRTLGTKPYSVHFFDLDCYTIK